MLAVTHEGQPDPRSYCHSMWPAAGRATLLVEHSEDGVDNETGRVELLGLGTAVPAYQFQQAHLAGWVAASFGDDELRTWIRRLYAVSGIETRHSCLPDAHFPWQDSRFAPGRLACETPTTAERMDIYQREATTVGSAAAHAALADCGAGPAEEVAATVTHLVVVSCTGFFAPGLDQAIARQLGLPPTVQRTLVGFMGCAAAFNGLRLAWQIVRAQPAARVLVVCVELCSLHMQAGTNRTDLVVASLFSDGASACLVGAPHGGDGERLLLDTMHSALVPETGQDMVWEIGNHGFRLHLSPDIPARLGEAAPAALAELLDGRPRPGAWAIHPGGRAIVARLASIFDLTTQDLAPTMHVLRHYGNMSSGTILFVLRELRQQLRARTDLAPTAIAAMAFGPGLAVEMAHLSYIPAAVPLSASAVAALEAHH